MTVYLKQFTTTQNAGDVVSGLIVGKLLGENDVRLQPQEPLDGPNLVAIGSILGWADKFSVVWGTGAISDAARLPPQPAEILGVRGPLTRRRLRSAGMSCPEQYGDPGVLISDIAPMALGPNTRLGVVPHYVDIGEQFIVDAAEKGAVIIDPRSPLPAYLAALANCETIISSSLHGIIFAHSYGIPAVWVKLSAKVVGDGFKFLDYYGSIGFNEKDVPALDAGSGLNHVVRAASIPRVEIDRTYLRDTLLLARDRVTVPTT